MVQQAARRQGGRHLPTMAPIIGIFCGGEISEDRKQRKADEYSISPRASGSALAWPAAGELYSNVAHEYDSRPAAVI